MVSGTEEISALFSRLLRELAFCNRPLGRRVRLTSESSVDRCGYKLNITNIVRIYIGGGVERPFSFPVETGLPTSQTESSAAAVLRSDRPINAE